MEPETNIKASAGQSMKAGLFGGIGVGLGALIVGGIILVVLIGCCLGCCLLSYLPTTTSNSNSTSIT